MKVKDLPRAPDPSPTPLASLEGPPALPGRLEKFDRSGRVQCTPCREPRGGRTGARRPAFWGLPILRRTRSSSPSTWTTLGSPPTRWTLRTETPASFATSGRLCPARRSTWISCRFSMSIIPSLAARHGESGPRLPHVGVARISGRGVVRISGTGRSILVVENHRHGVFVQCSVVTLSGANVARNADTGIYNRNARVVVNAGCTISAVP